MVKVTVFDCETTGKLTPEGRIIEASFRLCDLAEFTELKHFESRFNPERHIEARATEVHGIDDKMVKHEPKFKDKIGEIVALLEETDYLCAHNLDGFDLPYLELEFKRAEVKLPEFKTFDTLTHGTCCTDLGKSPTLFELCWAFGVAYDPSLAHGAAYDSAVLRDALFNAVRFGWFSIK